MFERFTERARKVVALAQEEARCMKHDYTGTEHLLLGLLLAEEGVAARALNSLNVTLDEVREQVESIADFGEERTGDQPPYTPRSKKVLELSSREALRLGHNHIGTEHILLGLVKEGEGVAVQALSNLNVTPSKVRGAVARMLDGRETPVQEVAYREGPEDVRTLTVKTRVKEIEVHVHCGVSAEERALPQKLLVDLEYVYEARGVDDVSGVVDYGVLLQGVARALERGEFQLLETGARMVGEHVLGRFPAVRQVTVTVTKVRVPVARGVSGVSVEATFVR